MGNAEERKQPPIVGNLLKKIDASPGFAGLSGVVQTVSHLIDNDGSSNKIVATILRDPALTANLLRVANSSSSTMGGHNISTIEQVLPVGRCVAAFKKFQSHFDRADRISQIVRNGCDEIILRDGIVG